MDEFARDPVVAQSAPPKPRKLPQQSRSRVLVASVKEACLKILGDKGPRALTATEIAEVSGVAMGSIYQYFPNVDAIVATVYEELIEDEVLIALAKQSLWRDQMTLRDSMKAMIRGTLAFHRRMLRLDQDFHQRFYQTFDLQELVQSRGRRPAKHRGGRSTTSWLRIAVRPRCAIPRWRPSSSRHRCKAPFSMPSSTTRSISTPPSSRTTCCA